MSFIDLNAPPEPGHVMIYKGQEYTLSSVTPYTRVRDGADSFLLEWETRCVRCMDPFRVRTGLKSEWPTRRCRGCRTRRAPKKLSVFD